MRQRFHLVCLLTAWVVLSLVCCLEVKPHRTLARAWAKAVPADTRWHSYLPLITRGAINADGQPSWSTPIATHTQNGSIWVVNPDMGSVSVIAPDTLAKQTEIAVGGEPWALAIAPDGKWVYVIDRARGWLIVVDAYTYVMHEQLPLGPEPGGIALSPSGATAFITLSTAEEIVEVDLVSRMVRRRLAVSAWPFAIAVTDDGDAQDDDEQVYVTHLFALPRGGYPEATDNGHVGRVTLVDAATLQITKEITLLPDAHGFPNMLTGIALGAGHAWLPHLRAAPALPNGLTTTVFAAVNALNLATAEENTAARLNLNDEIVFGSPVNNPVAAVPTPDGKRLLIVLAGSDLVEVVDIAQPEQPRLIKFLPVGKNPRGIALSPDGRRGYVMSYLSRTVTVLDLDQLQVVAQVLVTTEVLEPQLLRGKVLFNSAVIPHMAKGSWISCASCHADGGADGVTWMFPDGPRQSPPLWNSGRTLPWHWSAALDELQDVEDTIQVIQHGLGLAPGTDPPLLGTVLAGRSPDLDALASYLNKGIRTPAVPMPPVDMTQGRQLFERAGCVGCHAGPAWTTSELPGPAGTLDPDGNGMVDWVLHDVGTLNARDIRGASGFDVPSLLGAGLTAPYLHDGSQPSLHTLIASGHPRPSSSGTALTQVEIDALVTFIAAIGSTTPVVERR